MTWTALVQRPRQLDRYDVATVMFAATLGVLGVLLAMFDKHNVNVSAGAAIGVLFMTVAIAPARRRPIGVAAFIAVAALANGLIFGHVVRCGVALPAAFFVAYTVGSKVAGRRSWLGFGLCLGNVVAQCPYDPRLGWSAAPLLGLVAAAFYAAGRLVQSRSRMVDELCARNDELSEQRARTTAMAVAADRAQLAGDLDDGLARRLTALADTTVAGRQAVGTSAATDALASIETTGRSTLNQMREVVGGLRGRGVTEPQPQLSELRALSLRVTAADVRLRIDGDPARLPSGIEISAYRIMEHLLEALPDDPSARADARLVIDPDKVTVIVDGPLSQHADAVAILAKIQTRVSLHEGGLESSTEDGRCHVVACLPISVGVV